MPVEVSMGVFDDNALVPTWNEFVGLQVATLEVTQKIEQKVDCNYEDIQGQLREVWGVAKAVNMLVRGHSSEDEKNILERLKDIDECIGKLENRINNDLPAIVGKSADLAWKEFNTLLGAVKSDMDIIIGINNGKLVVVNQNLLVDWRKL